LYTNSVLIHFLSLLGAVWLCDGLRWLMQNIDARQPFATIAISSNHSVI